MTSLAPRVHFWPRPLVGRVNGMIKTDWPPHAVEQKGCNASGSTTEPGTFKTANAEIFGPAKSMFK